MICGLNVYCVYQHYDTLLRCCVQGIDYGRAESAKLQIIVLVSRFIGHILCDSDNGLYVNCCLITKTHLIFSRGIDIA